MKSPRILAVFGCLAFLFSPGLQAQTADDCIAEFETLQAQFDLASPGAELICSKQANTISIDAEGPLPNGCVGNWDHWHLEAKAVGGNTGFCSMMLRGLENMEGCGTVEFRLDLAPNEAAAWRKYLNDECGK